MMQNPFSRAVSVLGLLMIGVIAYEVAAGSIGLEDAAVRAAITLGAVLVLRRIARLGVVMLAQSIERDAVRAGSIAE